MAATIDSKRDQRLSYQDTIGAVRRGVQLELDVTIASAYPTEF